MKHSKKIACVLCCALLALGAAGCAGNTTSSAGTSSAGTSSAGTSSAGTSSASAGSNSTSSTASAAGTTYSDGLEENGNITGLKALDFVELPELKGVAIPAGTGELTEEELQTEIQTILDAYGEPSKAMDKVIADGDTVNIDYVGSVDGVEFDGGSTGGTGTEVTIGTTQYIDDFLEQLIGHKPGDSFDVEVTFPDSYPSNTALQGKDAIFKTTVNHVVGEVVVPELTDAFVSESLSADYGWKTVEEMKTGIKEKKKSNAETELMETYLMDGAKVKELPEQAKTFSKNQLMAYIEVTAKQYGMSVDDFAGATSSGATVDSLMEQSKDDIEAAAKEIVIYQAAAEKTGVEVKDGDVESFFKDVMGVADYASYVEVYGMPYVKRMVTDQLVRQYMLDNAKRG